MYMRYKTKYTRVSRASQSLVFHMANKPCERLKVNNFSYSFISSVKVIFVASFS